MLLELPYKRPLIMGIINVTPDSFSGDGVVSEESNYIALAIARAERMMDDGADLLDIGGESSRPGSIPVSEEEEMRRVIPMIAALKKRNPSLICAVDTVKAKVAERALDVGVDIINDISALQADSAMARVVAESGAFIVLMHNMSKETAVMQHSKIGSEFCANQEDNSVDDVIEALKEHGLAAERRGIAHNRIIVDPGIGFGKSLALNLALLKETNRIGSLGYPVLVGPSRKSFIGRVLGVPVEERLEGTAATIAISAFQGADILRVHDVKFMARVAKMAAAVGQN